MASASLFDDYLMVDWSAANQPKRGRDSIWLCHLARDASGASRIAALENPATRDAAYRRLRAILVAAVGERRSVLLGFDFPFGYSQGFARRLGLAGTPWRGIWDEIAGSLDDDPRNRSNRFAVAAEFNRRISGAAFPFWGCPPAQIGPFLAMTHHRRHELDGLAERRLIDACVRGPQPVWKLAGTGSAGSQALTGIPVARRLRDDPDLAAATQIWPFETGLRLPCRERGTASIVMTEIYPSLIAAPPAPGEVKDSAQVRCLAQHFAALDEEGALTPLFAGDPALSAAERQAVEREEGWTLGVVGKTARSPHPPAARAAGPSLSRKRARGSPAPPSAPSPACGRGTG